MAETMNRPEVDGIPVHIGDVLIEGGVAYEVTCACEGGMVACNDGALHLVDSMRWPDGGAGDAIAMVFGTAQSMEGIVSALSDIIVREWAEGVAYRTGDKVAYEDAVYRCLQAHTSQPDWAPDVAHSLWAKGYRPGEVPEWEQPTGATDAYSKGDRVRHVGKVWESQVDANVWEPGVFGWAEVA